MLASLLFVQFQNELTGEKEDFRGLSASQIPHTVFGIRSAFICCPGYIFSFPRFGISKLGQASFYLEQQIFGEFEFSCSSSMRFWRKVTKKLKLEQKGTRCKIPVFPSYAANRLSRKSSRGSMIFSLQREKKVPLWGMFVPPEGKKSTALVDVRPSRGTPWMSLWRTFEIAYWPRVESFDPTSDQTEIKVCSGGERCSFPGTATH